MKGFPHRRWGRPHRWLLPVLMVVVSTACDEGGSDRLGARLEPGAQSPSAGDVFSDATTEAGLDFVHFNGMSGELFFCEMMGAGGALFDYDRDGDLDLYLVQGEMLGSDKTLADALFPPPPGALLSDRLFRNDLKATDQAGELRFTDVTAESGIDGSGYGMGVAAGDFDNDGWVDLYVTNFGSNRLLRNRGNGTFADVTEKSRTDDPRWSTSASFLDFDRDGWLDLFVASYVDFTLTRHQPCFAPTSAPDYCTPLAYRPEPDRLFRNRRDGTFEDVTSAAGLVESFGGALGVVSADFNNDGWPDIYVANDQMPNQLWINGGDGRFRDEALLAGSALNKEGQPEASMGVDAGDFDGDGDLDLFLTHLAGEKNTLYVNGGSGWFEDRSHESGLALPSLRYTSFGTGWLDFDNDGWLDLMTVNGDVRHIRALVQQQDPFPLHQPNQLFVNRAGRFEDITDRAGPAFARSEVSRGAAFGDIDNDGDVDVVVFNNSGSARLLSNNVGHERRWLGLELVGTEGERDMLGARVNVRTSNGLSLWRRVRTDGSYGSSNDPRVLVGLDRVQEAPSVRVLWPSGLLEEWSTVPLDAYSTLLEGSGETVE